MPSTSRHLVENETLIPLCISVSKNVDIQSNIETEFLTFSDSLGIYRGITENSIYIWNFVTLVILTI
jgi:hypothetical protein